GVFSLHVRLDAIPGRPLPSFALMPGPWRPNRCCCTLHCCFDFGSLLFRSILLFTMFKPKLPSILPILHTIADLSIAPFRFVNPNLALFPGVEILNELFKEGVRGLCIRLLLVKLSELSSELLHFGSKISRWWSRWCH